MVHCGGAKQCITCRSGFTFCSRALGMVVYAWMPVNSLPVGWRSHKVFESSCTCFGDTLGC